jgi:hypothetical protein
MPAHVGGPDDAAFCSAATTKSKAAIRDVWNNTGDTFILRRADGSIKDTCSYSGACSKKYC